jgi:hypothetical protein
MKIIEAYKCNYCNKVYQLKKSCQAHERKCYTNPETKSCASCKFLQQKDYQYQTGYYISLMTCLRNHDVTSKLKTACKDFHFIKEQFDLKEMELIMAVYNPEPFIRPRIEKCKADDERRMKDNLEINVGDLEQISDAPF